MLHISSKNQALVALLTILRNGQKAKGLIIFMGGLQKIEAMLQSVYRLAIKSTYTQTL